MHDDDGTPLCETIIGFDARTFADDFDATWPQRRRELFLYRLDVRKVVSVDVRVWPTLFSTVNRHPVDYQPAMQATWAQLDALRSSTAELAVAPNAPPFRIVAITLVNDGAETTHPVAAQASEFVEPQALDPAWPLLGYDVGDAWLLSTLSNCGLMPGLDDVDALRAHWAPFLNQFHLFDDVHQACNFRRMSDQRLAGDHAPTYVYGLRVVR